MYNNFNIQLANQHPTTLNIMDDTKTLLLIIIKLSNNYSQTFISKSND